MTGSSRATLEHSRPAAGQLRAGTADSAGASIVEVVESEIVISGIDVVRLVDGTCAEHGGGEDTLGLFAQLGLSSIPAQPTVSIVRPSEVHV